MFRGQVFMSVSTEWLLSLLQDAVEDVRSIDSCEYIWEAGVGFAQSPPLNYVHDLNRWNLSSRNAAQCDLHSIQIKFKLKTHSYWL